LEVGRANVSDRYSEVEFSLNEKHKIDQIQRSQSNLAEIVFWNNLPRNRTLRKESLNNGNDLIFLLDCYTHVMITTRLTLQINIAQFSGKSKCHDF